MKGIMFTEFLELVETKFGLQTVDYIIEKSNLKSNGIYTSIGNYDFEEILILLNHLNDVTKISKNQFLRLYGQSFFENISKHVFKTHLESGNAIDITASIEYFIKMDNKKIYPNAILPQFEILEKTASKLIMVYHSPHHLYAFMHGIIEKIFEYYGEKADISYELIKEDGSEVRFEILK